MQVEGDVKCMQTNFIRHGLFGFGDIATFQIRQNFPFRPWGSKNRIDSKKFMQVEADVKCLQTNFGGCGFSGFRDLFLFVCLQK